MRPLEQIDIDLIAVGGSRRAVSQDTVNNLAESIQAIGLQTPITVIDVDGGRNIELVAGHHRLAAVRKLKWTKIPCFVIEGDRLEADMWEIAENLHRAELSALERDQQIARWLELAKARNIRQSDEKTKGRPGHRSAAAKEINVSEPNARRAEKVASLSEQAKQTARETGLDNNRTALLEAASRPESEQVVYLQERASSKPKKQDVKQTAANDAAECLSLYVPPEEWDLLKANLYAAGANNIANAFAVITKPVMDRAK